MAEVKGRLGDKSCFNIKVNILNLEYSRLFFVYQFYTLTGFNWYNVILE